jgi:hypothetical protein
MKGFERALKRHSIRAADHGNSGALAPFRRIMQEEVLMPSGLREIQYPGRQ